jgi:hypothetical protein
VPVRKDDGQDLLKSWNDLLEDTGKKIQEDEEKININVIDNTDPNRHLVERVQRLYLRGKVDVLEDFKSKVAAKEWPGYTVLPDGRSGPRPFRNHAEMEMYCRNYEFEVPK